MVMRTRSTLILAIISNISYGLIAGSVHNVKADISHYL